MVPKRNPYNLDLTLALMLTILTLQSLILKPGPNLNAETSNGLAG